MSADVERFAAGERFAVHPDAIERELASVWQEAGRSTDGGTPVTRACLWNVIVHPDGDLESLVRDLPRHLASRAVVLGHLPDGSDPGLRSYIAANCLLAPGGGKLVCSEEIRLEASPEGARHIPGLIRALLVPGVPVASVFCRVPGDDPVSQVLLEVSDRVVGAGAGPASTEPRHTDLRWYGQRELRRAIASLFEEPSARADLREIQVVSPAAEREAAGLVLGWMADRMGATSVEPKAGGYVLHHPDASVQVHFHAVEEEEARFGFAGTHQWGEVAVEGTGLRLRGPGGIERRPGPPASQAAWLARALLAADEDELYTAAARFAVRFSENQ